MTDETRNIKPPDGGDGQKHVVRARRPDVPGEARAASREIVPQLIESLKILGEA